MPRNSDLIRIPDRGAIMKMPQLLIPVILTLTGCGYPSQYQPASPETSDNTSCGMEIIPCEISMRETEETELTVVILEADGTRTEADQSKISYSFDENILSISLSGVIRGLSPGTGELIVKSGSFTRAVPFEIIPKPHYEKLIISEVMYCPAENERELEYIEIYNTGDTECVLDGVTVIDGGSSSKPFPLDGSTIGPKQFMVIGRSDIAFKEFYGRMPDAFPFTFDLSNSGDAVFLRYPSNDIIDSVYIKNGGGEATPPAQWGAGISAKKGKSLSRTDLTKNTGSSSDFKEADPTPGFIHP